jgi:hypothetical protein
MPHDLIVIHQRLQDHILSTSFAGQLGLFDVTTDRQRRFLKEVEEFFRLEEAFLLRAVEDLGKCHSVG